MRPSISRASIFGALHLLHLVAEDGVLDGHRLRLARSVILTAARDNTDTQQACQYSLHGALLPLTAQSLP